MEAIFTMSLFCRRNKAQVIVFVVAVVLLIRHSDIPYPNEPCFVIDTIFTKSQKPYQEPLGEFLDIFAGAYATSLIFHYVVNFAPGARKEQEALVALKPMIDGLVSHACALISLLLLLVPKESRDDMRSIDSAMNGISFKNEAIYCKVENCDSKGRLSSRVIIVNPYDCGRYSVKTIREDIAQIMNSPVFANAPWELAKTLTDLLQSDLLNALSFRFSADCIPPYGISFDFRPQSYSVFLKIVRSLGLYTDKTVDVGALEEAGDKEIEEFEKQLAESMGKRMAGEACRQDIASMIC